MDPSNHACYRCSSTSSCFIELSAMFFRTIKLHDSILSKYRLAWRCAFFFAFILPKTLIVIGTLHLKFMLKISRNSLTLRHLKPITTKSDMKACLIATSYAQLKVR
ncbi:MAG: hypothetical protein ACI8V8_002405 [Chitinophagales bacterium]